MFFNHLKQFVIVNKKLMTVTNVPDPTQIKPNRRKNVFSPNLDYFDSDNVHHNHLGVTVLAYHVAIIIGNKNYVFAKDFQSLTWARRFLNNNYVYLTPFKLSMLIKTVFCFKHFEIKCF